MPSSPRDPTGAESCPHGQDGGLSTATDASGQLRRHLAVLTRLALDRTLFSGDPTRSLQRVGEAAAEALDVERVSVWLYDSERTRIECIDLFASSTHEHTNGAVLRQPEFPAYFQALAAGRIVAAHDAHRDPATSEFSSSYLVPLGIGAMLDAPIRLGGELAGVVCHEHLGGTRQWSEEEQAFAASIADLVSHVFEEGERREALERLALRHRLEHFVAQLSTTFVALPVEEISTCFARALEEIGEFTGGVVVTYLERPHPDSPLAVQHLWHQPGSKPPDRLPGAILEPATAAGVERCLRERRPLLLDPGERLLADGEASSWQEIVGPVIVDGTARAALGLAISDPRPGWQEEAELLLRLVGDVLGNARSRELAESARRELQTRLFQMQKLEAIGRVAGGIAHDFNNLLSAILGFGKLTRHRLHEAGLEVPELDTVLEAGRRGSALTRQLLAFSRRQELKPQVVQLEEILQPMVAMLDRILGGHIQLETRCGTELRPIRVDPVQIEQVILNLAINGRDAMPDGGRLELRLENTDADLSRDGTALEVPCVELAISDTGCGMDAATRERIFEPFFTTKIEGEGTGLGLATVFGIVEQSGGRIRCDSAPGQGTTFRVLLPAARPESPQEPTTLPTPGTSARGSES